MEPTPARLSNRIERRKVQVVYYLHRASGHVEHPHLVEGCLPPVQDGLRLKDFKKWLSVLRGAAMPDSFSWSYKRSYKAGFIWQDLSNDDLIHPLQKHEYVLMGFELHHADAHQNAKFCKCDHYSMKEMKVARKPALMESSKLHELLKEGIMDYLNVSPLKDASKAPAAPKTIQMDREGNGFRLSFSDSFKAENLQSSLAGFSDCDEILQPEMRSGRYSADMTSLADMRLSMATALLNIHRSGEVKVYKAKEAEQTSDAATQTGESKRCSTEEILSVSSKPLHFSGSLLVTEGRHCESRNSLSSTFSPLFKPCQIQDAFDHADNFGLKDDTLSSKLPASCDHNVNAADSLSTTVSNKSEIFFSPSSVRSSCTVPETTSPGSARSLRSVNSVSSTRFNGNQMIGTTMESQLNAKPNASLRGAGSSSPLKAGKRCPSTHILKQLFSCGSVSTSEPSTMTLKGMRFHSVSSGPLFSSGSHARTPTKSGETPLSQSRRVAFQQRQCDEVSHPVTPKSWLCCTCGTYSSCLTSLEGHLTSSPQSCLASREGSFKGLDVHKISLAQPKPELIPSRRIDCPPVLCISPAAIALSSSLSPKQIRY